MSNFYSLLPLALDAGSPQEDERIVVRKRYSEPAPIPKAWLEPSHPPSRIRAVLPGYALLLAIVLGLVAWDYLAPPAAYVTPTVVEGGSCPAP